MFLGKGNEGSVWQDPNSSHEAIKIPKHSFRIHQPISENVLKTLRKTEVKQEQQKQMIHKPVKTNQQIEFLFNRLAQKTGKQYRDFIRFSGYDPKTGSMWMQRLQKPWEILSEFTKRLRREQSVERMDKFVRMMCGLVYALQGLHDGGIVHLDIKDTNIFVNPETGDIRLFDFGVSCDINGRIRKCPLEEGLYGVGGSTLYMPPEYFFGWKPPTEEALFEAMKKRDIYGVGLVIYEGLYGVVPIEWYGTVENEKKIARLYHKVWHLPFSSSFSDPLQVHRRIELYEQGKKPPSKQQMQRHVKISKLFEACTKQRPCCEAVRRYDTMLRLNPMKRRFAFPKEAILNNIQKRQELRRHQQMLSSSSSLRS